MDRRGFLVRAGLLAGGLGLGWWVKDHVIWRRPELAFAQGASTGWLPYATRRSNVPTVQVEVAGRPVRALIDSGAQYSVIDAALAAQLPEREGFSFDIPLVAYGVGGGMQTGRGTTIDLALPGLTVSGLRAAILKLGPLASSDRGGLGAPLILGQDVFGEAVFEVEPRRRRFRFLKAEGYAPAPDLLPVAAQKRGTALQSEITVEGATIQAVVDTGASALLSMHRTSAQQAGLLDGRPSETGVSYVLGGALRAQIVRAETVTFADQLYRRAPVGVFEQPPLPNFPDALIGMEAFEDRRAAFDLGGGRLWATRAPDVRLGQPARKVSQTAGSPD